MVARPTFALVLAAALFGGACAAPAGDDDAAEASEDALTEHRVDGLTTVDREARVATSDLPALVGPKVRPGARVVAIRALTFDGASARLVVDADALTTSLVRASDLERASRVTTATDRVAESPYLASLADLTRRTRALDHLDDDARTAGAREPFTLTIDMCQSRKPWEARLFQWAVRLADDTGKAVPIGVAMTGGWAKAYPRELDQLLGWERAGKLQITWINHSATHPLHCEDASCRRAAFLTHASVDFRAEVLGLERALLERGQAPSPIFRFPGLMHDATRLAELTRLSLMALDADAWIAKGQPIKPGAVVLVHGNGNEAVGIDMFLRQVNEPQRAAALRSGESRLVSPLLVAPVPPR